MAGRVAGKVAFITGAARGQGRSHAIRLAQEGADIIAVDLCGQVATVPYPMSTPEDLADTVKKVEALDRRIVATQADVRDYGTLRTALDDGEVHAEDGCELYALHRAEDRLVMIEKWASPEALSTHSRGPALAAMNPQLAGKVTARPEVIVLQAVPAGDPPKGEL